VRLQPCATRRSEFIVLPCFIFGCYSAVHGWNRYSHFATHCGRHLALAVTTGYYDDFQIYGPPWYCSHVQAALGALLDPLIGFDMAKHVLSDQRPWCQVRLFQGPSSWHYLDGGHGRAQAEAHPGPRRTAAWRRAHKELPPLLEALDKEQKAVKLAWFKVRSKSGLEKVMKKANKSAGLQMDGKRRKK
jgi:hypothetical protein